MLGGLKQTIGAGAGMMPGRRPDSAAPQARRKVQLPEATPVTKEELATLMADNPTIIVGEGRQFPIPKSTTAYVCLTADGTLFVSKQHQHHAVVPQLLDMCAKAEFEITTVHMVSMEEIAALNDRGARRGVAATGDLERMQKDVLQLFEEAVDYDATDILIALKNGRGQVRFCVNDNWIDHRELEVGYTRYFLAAAFNLCAIGDGTYKEGDYQMARLSSEQTQLPRNIESIRMQFGPLAGQGRFLVARLLFSRFGHGAMKSMAGLGYDPEHIRLMKRIRDTPFGVILMVGPTGSGKSTTLAVSLESRYAELDGKVNIVTIEDPPEYEIKGAHQLPISNVTTEDERKKAFAEAFNSVLRMKPHVIMVGEVRDLPAGQLLIKASQSGHQCWSSLHTKNALTVPVRLKEMGIEGYLVKDSSILVGTIFQRLVPKLCPECALPYRPQAVSPEVARMVETVTAGDNAHVRLRNMAGCKKCNKDHRSNPGYVGQTVVAEVLQPDDEILTACVEGRRMDAQARWLSDADSMTAFEHGLRKVYRGDVDPDDVYKRVFDRHDLARLDRDPMRCEFVRNGRPKAIRKVLTEPFAAVVPTLPHEIQQLAEIADHALEARQAPRRPVRPDAPAGVARGVLAPPRILAVPRQDPPLVLRPPVPAAPNATRVRVGEAQPGGGTLDGALRARSHQD